MVAQLENISYDDSGGFRAGPPSESDSIRHFHPEFELMLNACGTGTRIVGDSIEIFDSYDLVLIGSGLPHSWNYYTNGTGMTASAGLMLHFKLSSLGEAFLSQHELQSVRKLLMDSSRGILFSSATAAETEPFLLNMLNTRGLDKMVSFFHLLRVLCNADRQRFLCSKSYIKSLNEKGNKKINRAIQYIRDNYSTDLTLRNVSEIAELSPFSLSRYFKKHSGERFVDYLTRLRMEKARYFLRETKYQVKDIANHCGYQSISNFNRQFRRVEGVTPRDYRSRFL